MPTRVLLAEDNESLAQTLARFLAAQGMETTVAGTGIQALQAIAAHKPDLLILDLRLPELSGIEVLQKIRKSPQTHDLPVIIMTGVYKGPQYAESARKLGVSHYLEKPFTQQAFQAAVTGALARSSASSALDLLMTVYGEEKTGLLTTGTGSTIAFLRGEPVSFQSKGKQDFLVFLLNRGKLDKQDVEEFGLLGKERLHLTLAGTMTYDELIDESRSFLTKKLLETLTPTATASFTESAPVFETPLTPFALPQFVYEAIRSRSIQLDSKALLATKAPQYPARSHRFYRIANLISLRKEDIDTLQLIDGSRTVQEIAASAPEEATPFFSFLDTFGMIGFHPEPVTNEAAPFAVKTEFNQPIEELNSVEEQAVDFEDVVEDLAETVELANDSALTAPLSQQEIGLEQAIQQEYAVIQEKNYYELFDLTGQSFSFEALKSAYFSKTREYSPEKFMELSGNALSMAEEILSTYANAYNTLSNVVAKERYDEMLNADTVGLGGKKDDKFQAQIQFQSGQVFMEMGEYDNAEKALQDAYTLEPDNAYHCAYLAWAIYRNPANTNSRSAQDRARGLLAKSLQQEKTAEAFAFRGWMLFDEGRDGLAEGEFQKALKMNSRDSLARKGLTQITERREAEKKGIFRKIFG